MFYQSHQFHCFWGMCNNRRIVIGSHQCSSVFLTTILRTFLCPSFSRFLCLVLTLVVWLHVTVGGTVIFISGGVWKKSEPAPSDLFVGDKYTLFWIILEDADFRKHSSVFFCWGVVFSSFPTFGMFSFFKLGDWCPYCCFDGYEKCFSLDKCATGTIRDLDYPRLSRPYKG